MRYSDSLQAGRSANGILMGAKFSALVHTGPEAKQASSTFSTRSFPGIKRLGRRVDYPPPSRIEVKEKVYLYLYFPSGPSNPVQG